MKLNNIIYYKYHVTHHEDLSPTTTFLLDSSIITVYMFMIDHFSPAEGTVFTLGSDSSGQSAGFLICVSMTTG